MASEVVEASGHLIDSGILNGIFDTVIRHDASFEVLRFSIGRTNAAPSVLSMRVTATTEEGLRKVVENLVPLGCLIVSGQDVLTQPADQDGCAPVDFYSTTNHETHVRRGGQWMAVADQRMDRYMSRFTGTEERLRATEQMLSGLPPRRQPPKNVLPLRRPEVRARMA